MTALLACRAPPGATDQEGDRGGGGRRRDEVAHRGAGGEVGGPGLPRLRGDAEGVGEGDVRAGVGGAGHDAGHQRDRRCGSGRPDRSRRPSGSDPTGRADRTLERGRGVVNDVEHVQYVVGGAVDRDPFAGVLAAGPLRELRPGGEGHCCPLRAVARLGSDQGSLGGLAGHRHLTQVAVGVDGRGAQDQGGALVGAGHGGPDHRRVAQVVGADGDLGVVGERLPVDHLELGRPGGMAAHQGAGQHGGVDGQHGGVPHGLSPPCRQGGSARRAGSRRWT